MTGLLTGWFVATFENLYAENVQIFGVYEDEEKAQYASFRIWSKEKELKTFRIKINYLILDGKYYHVNIDDNWIHEINVTILPKYY